MEHLTKVSAILSFLSLINVATTDNLCPRVFFQFPSENLFPYFQLEGVYKRTDKIVDNFPIYEHEQGGIYFQHSRVHSKLYFALSIGDAQYVGLSADTLPGALASRNWMANAGQKPFDSLIRYWTSYYPLTRKHHIWYGTEKVEAFCVDEFIFKCTSNEIFFNNTFTNGNETINDLKTDYFSPLPGVYVGGRPVYQHTRQKTWYLFYADGHWIVGPDYNRAYGNIKVKTSVRRPEYVTKNWEYYSDSLRRWELFTEPVGMRCKGEPTKNDCNTTSSPCPADTECYYNMLNETVCKCKSGLSGPLCKTPTPRCPTYQLRSGYEKSAILNDGYVGDYLAVFCDENMEPDFTVGICRQVNPSSSPTWVQGTNCTRKYVPTSVATSTTPYPTRRPPPHMIASPSKFNADKHIWIRPTVLSIAVLVQFLLPVFFFLCDVGFCRATSLFLFVSMLLWAMFITVCAGIKCGQYGRIFADLLIVGFVVLLVGYIFNVVESWYCSEREYVSMVVEDTSLQHYLGMLRSKDVTLIGSIECYHMETRTRTVYYTDANGNTQTRIETYQERVVTYTESQIFHHAYFRDVSPVELPPLSTQQVTRLKITKIVKCGDQETVDALYRFKDDLVERNKHRDVSIAYYQHEDIDGFREHVCAYLDRVDRPFWLNSCCFWLATVLCLTWPYRWFFRFRTGKSFYSLEKEIFLHAPPANVSTHPTAPYTGSQGAPPLVTQPQVLGNSCPPYGHATQETTFGYPAGPPPDYESAVNGSAVPWGLQNHTYTQSNAQLSNNPTTSPLLTGVNY